MAGQAVTTTGDSGKGVRPDVKLGKNFLSSDGKTETANSWDLSYTPGSTVLEVQVQVALGSPVPSPGGLVTQFDEDGVNDMIAWLAGVKSAISQASSSNSNSNSGS